jgi:iron complex transport system substrate-binding protein
MKKSDKNLILSKREMEAALYIWNRADLSLLDIRHSLIEPEKSVPAYRLPANTFLFTSGGKARVILNDTAYQVDCFGLFHSGKGSELTIQSQNDWLEYYMVMYKAGEPSFHKSSYCI